MRRTNKKPLNATKNFIPIGMMFTLVMFVSATLAQDLRRVPGVPIFYLRSPNRWPQWLGGRTISTDEKHVASPSIRKSTDSGESWSSPVVLVDGNFGGTPNTPAIYNNRIWIAQGGSHVMSAPVNADLMKPGSWTRSNSVSPAGNPFGEDWDFWSEAQIVASPSTGVVVMPKIHNLPNTALIQVEETTGENKPPRGHDSNLLTFHRIKDFRIAKPDQVIRIENKTVMLYEQTLHKEVPLGKFVLGNSFGGEPLTNPNGLAKDPKNNQIYYVREAGGRILKFDSAGNFLSAVSVLPNGASWSPSYISLIAPDNGNRSWTNDANGEWDNPLNWNYWGRPDTNKEIATFGSAVSADRSITLKKDYTVKGLRFLPNAGGTYKIGKTIGDAKLILEADSGRAVIDVQAGSPQILLNLTLNSDTDLMFAQDDCKLIVSDLNLNGNKLYVNGPGTLLAGQKNANLRGCPCFASNGNGNFQTYGLESDPKTGGFHEYETPAIYYGPESDHPEEVFGRQDANLGPLRRVRHQAQSYLHLAENLFRPCRIGFPSCRPSPGEEAVRAGGENRSLGNQVAAEERGHF